MSAAEKAQVPTYDVPAAIKGKTWIDAAKYEQIYMRSISDPEGFWAEQAKALLTWHQPPTKILEWDFKSANIKWFEDGQLNVCANCLDRHVEAGHGNQVAIIWEGNEPGESSRLTYNELLEQVCKFANGLKSIGIEKGDRVCIYLQMIPELSVAMLACARIGAVHSIVFGAFSPDSLQERINDSDCKVLITQDTALRGSKNDIPMKTNGDTAVEQCPSIEKIIVVRRTSHDVPMQQGRDLWFHELVEKQSADCEAAPMDAEDPLFILYTSGSTGHPKGVLHTSGGYLLYATITFKNIFDYHDGDIYWCTADIGWVTGHSYIIYGPLSNRATTVMFEGVPNYPDFGRFWAVVDKYKVNQLYTAPTALRALMKEGDSWPGKYSLESLRILGTVGEPIKSPEWHWYYETIGKKRCPIVDTWWQTETGGVLITPLPGATKTKPGSATRPFFGAQPCLVDDDGKELTGNGAAGNLCMKFPWPGIMRTIYGNHDRFIQTYFSRFPGKYFTGDGCRRDEDGYYWITGRVDDIIIVSGHNLGTAEIEGAIGKHTSVAEAAVVGIPHDIKGQGIYAYVTLKTGQQSSDGLVKEIVKTVRGEIGPHAAPDKIQFTDGLPKTRSGKIMRRILRKIGEGDVGNLGDTSTLADPTIVEKLVAGRQ